LEYNSLINEKTPQLPQSTRGGERGSPHSTYFRWRTRSAQGIVGQWRNYFS